MSMSDFNDWKVVERDGYRFPPGLRLNLPFYLGRRFFRVGNPILLFEYLHATYGPVVHYRVGPGRIVLINEPELVREILIHQPQNFIKERTQKRMRILLGDGLITSDGEEHRRQRRIAAPAFHRQRIQAYGATMVEQAAKLRETWQAGRELDVAAEMMRVSLEIVARTLFGQDVTEDILSINEQVNTVMRLYNLLIALPSAETYMDWPIPGLRQFQRARKRLDTVMFRMISERRASGVDHGDLLSMLLRARDEEQGDAGLTDRQLRDEALTMFLAGYETVANALAWTWMLLAQNPDAETRLHAEVDSVLGGRLPTMEDLPKLKYTEMVLTESLRLYPPAWGMGREAVRDVEIGPYRLPAGTYFYFSQYLIQRDPRHFPDPLRFDPERFTAENKAGRPKFVYFPFGAGHRQCIGESFAWMEMTLVLATLAQRWQLRLVPGQTIAIQPKITLRPKYGIRMVPELRVSTSRERQTQTDAAPCYS
jgi:cytochrome P450